jgi:hypothetical protein
MPAETLHFNWEWDPLDLLHMPQKEISIELARLREFGIYRPVLTDLQYRSAEQQQGAYFNFSHLLHFIGNAVLISVILIAAVWIIFRCVRWRRSQRQSTSRPTPRLDRANDPIIRAQAAALILGANLPRDVPPPRYQDRGCSTPNMESPSVAYNAQDEAVEMRNLSSAPPASAQPYADAHLKVRSEHERQHLMKHLQSQMNRLSTAPMDKSDA